MTSQHSYTIQSRQAGRISSPCDSRSSWEYSTCGVLWFTAVHLRGLGLLLVSWEERSGKGGMSRRGRSRIKGEGVGSGLKREEENEWGKQERQERDGREWREQRERMESACNGSRKIVGFEGRIKWGVRGFLVCNVYTCNGAVQSCILYNKRSGGR